MDRSPLHTKDIMSWLDRRYRTTVKDKYICLPEQRMYIQTLEKLFDEFDKDGSKSLSVGELCELFKQYGIEIRRDEMEHFFSIVDSNNDGNLSPEEFKRCLLDPKANAFFKEMITRVKSHDIVQPLPTFKKVLNQITYLEGRSNCLRLLYDNEVGIKERSDVIPQLLKMNNKIDVQTQFNHQFAQRVKKTSSMARPLAGEVNQIIKQAKLNGYKTAIEKIKQNNPFILTNIKNHSPRRKPTQFVIQSPRSDRQHSLINSVHNSSATLTSPRKLVHRFKYSLVKAEPSTSSFCSTYRTRRAETENSGF